jgi:hypothetical protein
MPMEIATFDASDMQVFPSHCLLLRRRTRCGSHLARHSSTRCVPPTHWLRTRGRPSATLGAAGNRTDEDLGARIGGAKLTVDPPPFRLHNPPYVGFPAIEVSRLDKQRSMFGNGVEHVAGTIGWADASSCQRLPASRQYSRVKRHTEEGLDVIYRRCGWRRGSGCARVKSSSEQEKRSHA